MTKTTSTQSTTPPVLFFPDATAWETWLESHPTDTAGVWLQLSKKGAARESVTYDAALDSALCFGWIDGQTKTLDADSYLRRFTPRRRQSMWSQRNVGKVAALTASGRMRAAGLAEVTAAQADGRWGRAYASPSTMTVPEDFRAALDASAPAAQFFDALGKSQRYAFVWRLDTVKKAETRQRKIKQFVEMLLQQKTL